MRIACVASEDIQLGFGYVISYLKSQGHDVKLFFDPRQFDRGYSRNSFLSKILNIENYIVKKIKHFNPDVCCFSCVTANYKWALRMAYKVKKNVGCKVIFGGTHPTLVREEVKSNWFIDDVIIGDGVKYFGGEFDADKIFPDREIFLKELPPEHRKIQLFMTSIGCPFNCSYCGNQQLRAVGAYKYTKRTVEGCIEELKQLKEKGTKYVLFVDDILTLDEKWFADFMLYYKRDINLPYGCFIHPKFVNEKIVSILKESGCQSAWMGIQTGYEPLRKEILNRPETNKEIIDSCILIKQAGIKLLVDHIFGIPFENEMSQDFSQQLYDHIKPDIINCYQLLYFPKAEIIKPALTFGYLTPDEVIKINKGEGIVYQTGNKGQKFYDTYMKAFITIPLGGILFEFLPTWLIKSINLIRAGRGFTFVAIIQNEVFFTWNALLKKAGLHGIFKKDL